MNTLKWATLSPVAPDDTPAFVQIIQIMDNWTGTLIYRIEVIYKHDFDF